MSRRPAPRPVSDNRDRPEVNKPEVEALREVVMVAMLIEAAREVIQLAPEIGQEGPGDPFINWQTIYARKEDELEVHAPPADDQASISMFGSPASPEGFASRRPLPDRCKTVAGSPIRVRMISGRKAVRKRAPRSTKTRELA